MQFERISLGQVITKIAGYNHAPLASRARTTQLVRSIQQYAHYSRTTMRTRSNQVSSNSKYIVNMKIEGWENGRNPGMNLATKVVSKSHIGSEQTQ